MKKTKLGVSVGILGAAVYILGIVNAIPLVLAAGYILMAEEDEWLRKSAVKAVAIVLLAALVPAALGLLTYVFDMINIVFGWVGIGFKLGYPLGIDKIIKDVVWFVRDALLLLCGFSALSKGTFRVGKIDSFVDKHMQ